MFNHRVAFVHPDLGIGGAERLVVDAAVGLRRLGAQVTIFTSHYDPTHAFEQTRELDVRVYGDWLPRSFFGRFAALCAYIRSVYLAIMILLFGGKISVFFCDSISIAIPVLQLKAPVLFYCHFPDKLLTQRTSFLKLIYRMPLDLAEQLTTGLAQLVLVNSHFTARQYASAFPLLRWCCPPPQVLYPAVDVEQLGDGRAGGTTDTTSSTEREESDWAAIGLPVRPRFLLLSINRFERKKNVGLAVLALAKLRDQLATTPTTTGATGSVVAGFHNNNSNNNNNNSNNNNNNNNSNSNNNNSPDDDYDFFKHVHLVLAGGYDTRVAENVEHAAELELLAARLGVADHVTQLRSCSSDTKLALLRRCLCLLYTPENEHFGIVPLEAMSVGRPVIALNSGGPTETVEADWPGKCGFLCNARQDEPASEEKDARIAAEMATHLRELVLDPARASLIGANGIARVSLFGLAAFSTELLRFTQAVSRERRSVLMRMCGLVALAPLLVYPVVAAMVSSFFFSFFA